MERLEIEISDSGIGIPEADLVHIFDRFYQADNSSTRAREGSGIGLAHAKELVGLMQGKIEMSSEIEKGTQVLISLPVTQEAVADVSEYQPLDESEVMTLVNDASASSNLTIGQNSDLPQLLIIEDNADVVAYLKSCLENDYLLDVAYNGRIGIEKALEDIPDLIISDVMMPEKDGYEVCDFLKNDERTSHIPIILLTAKADSASKITGLRQGADAYLSKPFDVTELLVRLENLNDLRRKMKEKYKGALLQTSPSEKIQSMHPKEAAFIKKITDTLEKNYAREEFSLPDFCKAIGMSRPQLFRKLKALTGTSPSNFIRSFRLQKARALLETTDINVNEVAFRTGFKDPSYFSKVFQEEFSVKPSSLSK
jgi:DNA-binding response OmpR family regulator